MLPDRKLSSLGRESNQIESDKLREALRGDPLWYIHDPVGPMVEEYFLSKRENMSKEWLKIRKELVLLVADCLSCDQVLLGDRPEGFDDEERKLPPSIVVVHHTHTDPTLSYWYINALGLLRLYTRIYKRHPHFRGEKGEFLPISSGHLYGGRQTFVGYHHMIWPDGRTERFLKDEYIGFQAGNWKMNCESVGIALVGAYEVMAPSNEALDSLAQLVAAYHPQMVLGHREVPNPNGQDKVGTSCPGDSWGQWKDLLLQKVRERGLGKRDTFG